MNLPVRSAVCLLALLLFSEVPPAGAQAAANSFEQLRGRLKPGDVIYVTDSSGDTTRATLGQLTSSSLELVSREPALTERDVRQIRVERNDPPWRGMLIGLVAVGGPWLALCASSHDWCYYNEYGGEDLYRRIALVTTGLAAGTGALIDASIKEKVIVYDAPGQRSLSLRVSPLVSGSAAGLRVSARF